MPRAMLLQLLQLQDTSSARSTGGANAGVGCFIGLGGILETLL